MKTRYAGRTLAILVLTAMLITALSACGADSPAASGEGSLKIGVLGDVPGFGYYNESSGRSYGLEVDIAMAIAEKLGEKNPVIVTVTAKDKADKLRSGEVDILVANYVENAERALEFDFSTPYYYDSTSLLIERSLMYDSRDVSVPLIVGTLTGSNTKKKVEEAAGEGVLENIQIHECSDYPEGSRLLELGQIDAFCAHESILRQFLNDDREIVPLYPEGRDIAYSATTLKDSELSDRVEEAVCALLADGVIDDYVALWLKPLDAEK